MSRAFVVTVTSSDCHLCPLPVSGVESCVVFDVSLVVGEVDGRAAPRDPAVGGEPVLVGGATLQSVRVDELRSEDFQHVLGGLAVGAAVGAWPVPEEVVGPAAPRRRCLPCAPPAISRRLGLAVSTQNGRPPRSLSLSRNFQQAQCQGKAAQGNGGQRGVGMVVQASPDKSTNQSCKGWESSEQVRVYRHSKAGRANAYEG